ncbi:MAG: hypothetical protein P4L87_03080 [Formivibrio sp.]|nr:hypothetical protein [Formivibrio sp.]
MTFGFAEANSVDGPATYGGFDQGTFQSEKEYDWYRKIEKYIIGKPKKRSGLSANQADAEIAAASFSGVVLTLDKKSGPIPEAKKQGGKIIYLSDNLLAAQSLGEICRSFENK